MIGRWTPCQVALIDSIDSQRVQLHDRLGKGGCTPELFADASGLLTALSRGIRFELLVVVEDGTRAWSQLSAVCGVIGMPALLLVREPGSDRSVQWQQDVPASPLFDFASIESENGELYSRVYRLLHRASEFREPSAEASDTVFGDYEFHESQHAVVHAGRRVQLQRRQFELAQEFFRNPGRVLERQQLWTVLWGTAYPTEGGRSLDVCVANVRKKLQLCAENGFTLNAVYGRGYQLRAVRPLSASATPPHTAAPTHLDFLPHSFPPRERAAPAHSPR